MENVVDVERLNLISAKSLAEGRGIELALAEPLADDHPCAIEVAVGGGMEAISVSGIAPRGETPKSVAITVDHPRTRQDQEYAESAARALRTHHTNVPVNGCYRDHLTATIAATGEPPNHVQSAYFLHLALRMRDLGLDRSSSRFSAS